MGDGFTIDLGSAAPYIVESVLGLFGKDSASSEWKHKIGELVKLSNQQASMVQCVGMPEPIPIAQIYQRTTLCLPARRQRLDFRTLLDNNESAVIFAGPGWGKTTFLHWTYSNLCKQQKVVPLLFTLRWPGAVESLSDIVQQLQLGRDIARKKGTRLILLVDGYDEIKEDQRQIVSQSLMLFASLDIGSFYLTCRSHYHVYDIKCRHLEIGPFAREDALGFVRAYSTAYGSEVNGETLLQELEGHKLDEFYRHPLMLTLVCILKSGPSQQVPRRSIGLLRRAIDTLTFRWDEAKRVHRQSTIPLDGEERVRCLMRIAFDMNTPQEPWEIVRNSATDYLKLLQVKGVAVRDLLEEMARFYGILVPVGGEHWQFAHRTIHDYLSARYWVESGKFNPAKVFKWDMHAAYAACLTADATASMTLMLQRERELVAFTECLYNSAPFEPQQIAQAVISRSAGVAVSGARGQFPAISKIRRVGADFSVQTEVDLYSICSDEFLRVMLAETPLVGRWANTWELAQITDGARSVAICAMGELYRRGARVRSKYVSIFKLALGAPEPDTFSCLVGENQYSFKLRDLMSASKD